MPGSGAFSVGDGDVITTKADVWHPDYFVECKQRKSLPLWSDFMDARKKARRYEKTALIVLDNPDTDEKYVVFDLDDLDLVEDLTLGAYHHVHDLLTDFYVVHEVHRRRWTYGKMQESVEKADAEGKPLLLALHEVGRTGQLGVLELDG